MDSTLQTVLVVVFALSGAAWIATVALGAVRGARVRSGDDAAAVIDHARWLARLARRVTMPAAIVVAATGGWWVYDSGTSLGSHWWIGTAIGAWLVCVFGATLVRAPLLSTAVQLSTEHGADDEDVQWRIRQVDLTGRGELLLLVVTAVVVAIRPGLDAFGG